jgi:hypothetical protein
MAIKAGKMRVTSYGTAVIRAAKAKNMANGTPLSVRTRLVVSRGSESKHKAPGCIYAVEYCFSEVVRYHPSGIVEINCHGWETKTTKQRIREHSDVLVFSARGDVTMIPFGWGTMEIPIRTDMSYFIDRGSRVVYGPDWEVYDKKVVKVGSFKPLPKVRQPAKTMFNRDVLTDDSGNDWMVRLDDRGQKILIRYYGDDPNNRAYAHLGDECQPINDLFILSMGDRYTAKERYVRRFERRDILSAA